MAQATIDLGLNTASFTAGLNEAERKSQSFEGRIAGLFRRSPLQRAERAFSELAVNLSTGNVAQGIAAFSTKLSGLGLAAGVAVGAAVGLFQKFRSEILITDKAAKALGADLATLGGTRGPEQVAEKFKAIATETENLITASKSAGNEFANFLDKYVNPVLGTTSRRRGQAQTSEIEAGFAAQGRLLSDRAKAEERVASIKIEALQISEREARIDAILNDAAIKRSQIEEDAAKFQQGLFAAHVTPERRDKLILASRAAAVERKKALTDEAAAEIDAANRIAEAKDRQLDIDQDIATQALRGVSTEDQKISRLQQELSLIQDQLKSAELLTAENRKQLQTSQAKTLAELAAARAAASGRPVLSNRDIHERAKLSLADIAANATQGTRLPFNLADEQLFGEQAKALGPAAMARQALRSEEFARQAALRGDLGTAETLFGMSDKLRAGIPGLKSAEKPISMADALKEYGKGPEIVTKLEELKAKMDSYWGN